MKLRGTSQAIERVITDTIVLFYFEDERPLKGAAGLADWRMCGRISKLIMSDFVSGEFGEPLLMPASHRLPWEKILTVGLGRRDTFDIKRYRQVIDQMINALDKMNIVRFALALPGTTLGDLEPGQAAEILGEMLIEHFGTKSETLARLDATVVAERDALKIINPVLARLERSVQ